MNAVGHTVDDVKIRFQLCSHHAVRVDNALLSIDIVALDDRVDDDVLLGDSRLLGFEFNTLDFLCRDC